MCKITKTILSTIMEDMPKQKDLTDKCVNLSAEFKKSLDPNQLAEFNNIFNEYFLSLGKISYNENLYAFKQGFLLCLELLEK